MEFEELSSSRNSSNSERRIYARVDTQCRALSNCLAFDELLACLLYNAQASVAEPELDQLEGSHLGRYRLQVRDFAQSRFKNQRQFELALPDLDLSDSPEVIFRGTFSAAVRSLFVPGWIDGELVEQAEPGPIGARLWDDDGLGGLAVELAPLLGSVIPAGGRLWLAYEQFGEEGQSLVETREGLKAKIPVLATPMGYLLYRADCWLGPRDWDIPEGGREGPRKVQGNKALDWQHQVTGAGKTISNLNVYRRSRMRGELHIRARARAEIIVHELAGRFGQPRPR